MGQHSRPDDARVITSDIDHFWQAWDDWASATSYDDSVRILFQDYYLRGSPGLRDFIRTRIGSAFQLVDVVGLRRDYYATIRASTLRAASLGDSVHAEFERFARLYPDATFPDVYFVVGALNSGGTTSRDKILIGTEMYGLTRETPMDELDGWLQSVLRPIEDIPIIVAHELIHVQQRYPEDAKTLLAAAIKEGAADFLGELISGANINTHVHSWANPREAELWGDFQKVMHGTSLNGWLYSSRAKDEPSDLGYWMGYKIVQAYYDRARDKSQAIRDILNIQDFDVFLEQSGYAERFAGP